MKNVIILLLMAILLPFLSNAQDFWQPSNGPYIGYIGSVAINSTGTFLLRQSMAAFSVQLIMGIIGHHLV